MSSLLWLLVPLAPLVAWCSLGRYALQEFAYSRLEHLCEKGNRPERMRAIMTQQNHAAVILELLTSAGIIALGLIFLYGVTWPAPHDYRASIQIVGQGVGGLLLGWLVVDLVPWTLAQVLSEHYLYRSWPVIHGLLAIFQPVVAMVRALDRMAHRLVGRGEPEEDDASVIDDEIRTVVDEGRREGVLPSDAGVMIERVMELQHEDVGAIMTPRTDMSCIHVDASLEEARRQLLDSGHSRMPIIGDSADDILGILYAKDLLKALEPSRAPGEPVAVLRDIIREPVYVPVTTQIPSLLELMKKRHVQIAIVMDEYGGVAGLVTMEDILEEIVGEIEDEYDEDIIRQRMTAVSETITEVDARVHLDDLNERFGYHLPDDHEYDTIGGFVFTLAGRVPVVGETVHFGPYLFTVLAADRRKVTRVRIELVEHRLTAESDAAI